MTHVVLKRFHIACGSWIHAPVILIIFEKRLLTIDQSAKKHLAVERNKELGEWVDIFNPVIDIFDRVEIAGLAGRRRPDGVCRGVDLLRLDLASDRCQLRPEIQWWCLRTRRQ